MEDKILDNLNSVQTTNKTLAEKVADQINNLIIEQKLKPGDKMPNEFILCEKLSVGRGTVREAEKILVARHILSVQQGRGTFIAKHTGMVEDPFGLSYMDDKPRLAHELYDLRLQLEPWIAEQAALNRTEANLKELKETLDKLNELQRNQKDKAIEEDVEFHKLIAKATQNRIIPKILPAIDYSIQTFLIGNTGDSSEESIRTHTEIYLAIERGDPEGARKAMEDHLKINLQCVVDLINQK